MITDEHCTFLSGKTKHKNFLYHNEIVDLCLIVMGFMKNVCFCLLNDEN